MRQLDGLAELAQAYDGFIVDLWGVVHDGVAPYRGALECLARLNEKRVLLLSNAPRRAWSAREALRVLGVSDHLYSSILTSGEEAWLALRDRVDPWFAALGKRVYHVGPARDRNVMDGLDLTLAVHPADADFVLNTGPDDHRNGEDLNAFVVELEACLRQRLPMVCANPDLEIVRGGRAYPLRRRLGAILWCAWGGCPLDRQAGPDHLRTRVGSDGPGTDAGPGHR